MGIKLISARRFAGAGLVNLFYLIVQSLLFVLLTPWMLRVLGTELYGLWTILISLLGFAGLANLSANVAVVKYVSQFSISRQTRDQLGASVLMSGVFLSVVGLVPSVAIWLVRSRIAGWLSPAGSADQLSDAVGLIGFTVLPLFLTQFGKGVLAGLVRNEIVGGLDLAQNGGLLIGAIIIGSRGGTILDLAGWILFEILVLSFISVALALWFLRPYELRWNWDRRLAREMMRYSAFAWLTTFGSTLFNSADRLLVGVLLGPAAAGAYAICTGIAMRLNLLAGVVTQLLLPFSSSYQAAGRMQTVRSIFRYSSRITACLLVGAAAVLVIWSRWILTLWISPEFASLYGTPFQIVVVCYAIFSFATPAHQIAQGLGRTKATALLGLGGSLLMVTLVLVLAPLFGLTGAAIANLGYAVVVGLELYVARLLNLSALPTVLALLGPPLAVLFCVVILISTLGASPAAAALITLAAIIVLTRLALSDELIRNVRRLMPEIGLAKAAVRPSGPDDSKS